MALLNLKNYFKNHASSAYNNNMQMNFMPFTSPSYMPFNIFTSNYTPYSSTGFNYTQNLYNLLFSQKVSTPYSYNNKFSVKRNSYILPSLKEAGYNAAKGSKLASIAAKNAVGFTGYCAKYVKKDIQEAGLGRYQSGHAYECDEMLDNNPNFKEISTAGLNLKDLPAGCILVYNKGVAGYSSKYGHIEITDGNGGAYSDGKTTNIRPGAKVYLPVSREYA